MALANGPDGPNGPNGQDGRAKVYPGGVQGAVWFGAERKCAAGENKTKKIQRRDSKSQPPRPRVSL